MRRPRRGDAMSWIPELLEAAGWYALLLGLGGLVVFAMLAGAGLLSRLGARGR